MTCTNEQSRLISTIADLQEEEVIAIVRERLIAGDDPGVIIASCQEGMRQVGKRYEEQQYYLSGLIMAGEIFREVMEFIRPVIARQISDDFIGRVLLGTVKDDIHDLGKNIVSMLLSSHKFTVCDLGVDVLPEEFLRRAKEINPHIIGLSVLLTSAYDSLRKTISLLRTNGCKVPIIIGGWQLTEEICRYAGADYWVTDAVDGVTLCKRLLAESNEIQAIGK